MSFQVTIDTSEIDKFLLKSPKRALWAARESLSMAGGHWRKEISMHTSTGGGGKWDPLKKPRPEWHGGFVGMMTPLKTMHNFVRFRVSKIKKTYLRLRVGFFHVKLGNQTAQQYRDYKARWKEKLGMTPAAMMKIHARGRSQRVTKKVRGQMHRMGWHLKKSTSVLKTPKRDPVGDVYQRDKHKILIYLENRFYQKWFNRAQGPKV